MIAAKCGRIGCASEKPPIWCPVLVVYARPKTTPARGRLEIRFCDDCRELITVAMLLSDDGWRRVLGRWPRGKALPQRALTELDFDLVELDEDPMED
jgi:hypothetical protein